MKKIVMLTPLTGCWATAMAQSITVRGKVSDQETKEAVFGAKGSVQDLNDIPDYTASISKRIRSHNETRTNTSKHLLWPIPQGELDKNKNLKQNSGW